MINFSIILIFSFKLYYILPQKNPQKMNEL